MKRLLLALAFFLFAPSAWAQCSGVFPPATICGNNSGIPNVPTAIPNASIASNTVDPITFGADPTGVMDSTAAINNAILSLDPGGGEVRFNTCGTYSVRNTINAGNGSSGVLSTRNGVRITSSGMGDGKQFVQNCVTLRWDSVANGTMVFAQGPMSGFEFSGIDIDCQSVADYGLVLTSVATWESHRGVHIKNCRVYGVALNVTLGVGAIALNTMQGVANNWVIEVPAVAGATGIILDGNCAGTIADVYQNIFNNMQIFLPNTVAVTGVQVARADTNVFNQLLVFSPNGVVNAGTKAVVFTYGLCFGLPAQNRFNQPDVGFNIPAAQQWNVVGTPTGSVNFIDSVNTTNGGADPIITLSAPYAEQALPQKAGQYVSTGNTTTIGTFSLYTIPETGWYRLNSYIRMTVAAGAGTVTTGYVWTDDFGAISGVTPFGALDATNTAIPNIGTIPFYAIAGSVVFANATASGLTGSPQYTWRIVVEKL
jgi:hypothetical protein